MPQEFVVEANDGSRHTVTQLTRSDESGELIYYVDAGPTLGRVRAHLDDLNAAVLFCINGPTFGRERVGKERVVPPALVDAPALLVNGAISVTATVGDELTVTMGNWSGEPAGYEQVWWREEDTEIGTGESYTVVAADSGFHINCVVTATNAAGSTEAPPTSAVLVDGARSRSSGGKK